MTAIVQRRYGLYNPVTGKNYHYLINRARNSEDERLVVVETKSVIMYTRRDLETIIYNLVAAGRQEVLDQYSIVCYNTTRSESKSSKEKIIQSCSERAILNKIKYGNT